MNDRIARLQVHDRAMAIWIPPILCINFRYLLHSAKRAT